MPYGLETVLIELCAFVKSASVSVRLFASHTYVGTLIRLFAVLSNGTSVVSLSVLRSYVLFDFLTGICFSHFTLYTIAFSLLRCISHQ